jgi:hypothetical protein
MTPLAGLMTPLRTGRRRGAAAPPGPDSIEGLILWLDGADAGSVDLSGGLVDRWADKSGLGNDAAATGSVRPTFTPSAHNGRSSLTFSGGQGMEGTAAIPLTSTLFAVGSVGGDSQALIEVSATGASTANGPCTTSAAA